MAVVAGMRKARRPKGLSMARWKQICPWLVGRVNILLSRSRFMGRIEKWISAQFDPGIETLHIRCYPTTCSILLSTIHLVSRVNSLWSCNAKGHRGMDESFKIECLVRGSLSLLDTAVYAPSLDASCGNMGDSLKGLPKLILFLRLPLVSDNGDGSAISEIFAVPAGDTGHSADVFRS